MSTSPMAGEARSPDKESQIPVRRHRTAITLPEAIHQHRPGVAAMRAMQIMFGTVQMRRALSSRSRSGPAVAIALLQTRTELRVCLARNTSPCWSANCEGRIATHTTEMKLVCVDACLLLRPFTSAAPAHVGRSGKATLESGGASLLKAASPSDFRRKQTGLHRDSGCLRDGALGTGRDPGICVRLVSKRRTPRIFCVPRT
jgi:hypothetical protein